MAARVYQQRRGRAHLAEDGNGFWTFCGLVNYSGWLGTGCQAEYEEAAHRRLCQRCERRAAWKLC